MWIGSVSLQGMRAQNAGEMVENTLRVMQSLVPYQPDIICLPEVFAYSYLTEPAVIREVAEQVPGAIVGGLIIGVSEKVFEVYWGGLFGGGTEAWFAYMLALIFLLFRPQGLFGEKIIERV